MLSEKISGDFKPTEKWPQGPKGLEICCDVCVNFKKNQYKQ